MKFYVGERVEQISDLSPGESRFVKITSIEKHKDSITIFHIHEGSSVIMNCNLSAFVKIGEPMNKYDELKERIDKVEGWTKEADDILREMFPNCVKPYYRISIPAWNDTLEAIKVMGSNNQKVYFSESYSSQCEKNSAFKEALMWLLDHSDIKKDEKKEKIEHLETYLQEIKDNYQGSIKKVEAKIQELK